MYIISYLKMQNGTCPLLHDGSEISMEKNSSVMETIEPTSSTPMSVD